MTGKVDALTGLKDVEAALSKTDGVIKFATRMIPDATRLMNWFQLMVTRNTMCVGICGGAFLGGMHKDHEDQAPFMSLGGLRFYQGKGLSSGAAFGALASFALVVGLTWVDAYDFNTKTSTELQVSVAVLEKKNKHLLDLIASLERGQAELKGKSKSNTTQIGELLEQMTDLENIPYSNRLKESKLHKFLTLLEDVGSHHHDFLTLTGYEDYRVRKGWRY